MNVNSKLTKLDIASWAGFMIFATSAVITPICLPEISKTLSTSLSEGGGMETARTFVVFIVMLLAGVVAQRWGKKRFITLGQYMLALGLLLVSFSQNYPLLILSLMIIGIGGGFSEALINPLVVDIHPNNSGKFLNLTNAFYSIGVMGSALIIGELLTLGYSWRIIFRIAAIAALVVAIYFTTLRFPSAKEDEPSSWKLFANILIQWGFWLFAIAIFIGAGVESALTFWSRSYVESYLSDVPRAGAIAVVIFAAAMAAGRLLAAYLSNRMSLKMIMMGSALLGLGVSGMIPLATNLVSFYGLLALAGMATACFWPTILAEAETCLEVNTTILFVLLACAGIAGFGFVPWIMGVIGDNADLRTGFALIPGLFIGLIIILAIEWRMSDKKTSS